MGEVVDVRLDALYNVFKEPIDMKRGRGMKYRGRFLYLLKTVILTILFCVAVYFENAQQQRLYALISIFLLYLAVGLARAFTGHGSNLYQLSFIMDIILVYALEYNSRLLINYFFHTFYIIALLEAALTLRLRRGITIGTAAVLVSLIKYVYLIYYKFNLSNVSQLAFFLMVNILILVIAGFAQYNKEERENKDVLYKELLDAHKKLKQYSDEVNRLAVVEERNRIARDLHDTLGHNMTALIMQMEMAAHMLEEDGTEAGSLLEKAKKTARDSLSGIREVVETLRGRDDKTKGSQSIEELVKEFSMKTGVNIKLDLSGASGKLSPEAEGILFRIVQEALTNSVRHGKATEVEIVINCTGGGIEFYIKDNGEGTADYKEGYGMRGIREWVEAMKGKVEFLSRDGFAIKGSLKLEGGYDKRIDC